MFGRREDRETIEELRGDIRDLHIKYRERLSRQAVETQTVIDYLAKRVGIFETYLEVQPYGEVFRTDRCAHDIKLLRQEEESREAAARLGMGES